MVPAPLLVQKLGHIVVTVSLGLARRALGRAG